MQGNNHPQFPSEWRFVLVHKGGKNPISLTEEKDGWVRDGKIWEDAYQFFGKTVKGYSEKRKEEGKDPWYKTQVGAIGCLAGEISGGLMMLDHDGDSCDRVIAEWGELPETWMVSSGRPGHYQLMFQVPKRFWNAIITRKYRTGIVDEDGKHEQIELRWNGCQSLVYGTHPETGNQYQWIVSEGEIAEAPLWLIEKMLKPENEHDRQVSKPTGKSPNRTLTENDWAHSYLDAINPNPLDWYTWRDCLFAAHSAGLSEHEARQWSAQSSKHTDRGFDAVWKHIKGSSSRLITLGTLGYLAKQNGWESPFKKDEWDYSDRPATVKNLHDRGSTTPTADKYQNFREQVMLALQLADPVEREFSLDEIAINFRKPRTFLQKIIEELEQRQKPQKAKTRFSLHELLNLASEATRYLIEDWIPMGESILLSAKPKVGKSLLAYEAAFAVATGTEFLGKRSKRGKVLIIQTEEGTGEIRKRLYTRGFDDVPEGQITIWTDWRFHRHSDRAELEEALAKERFSLVIIDSLRKVQSGSGIDENKPEFAMPVYELTDVCRSYGASLIVIHHDNKNQEAQGTDAIAGTGALAGAVWGTWRLLRKSQNEDNTERFLSCVIRGGASSRHNIRLTQGEACSWMWEWQGELNADPEVYRYEQRIMQLLAQNKRALTMREVCELIGVDPSARVLQRPMNRLIERGRVIVERDEKNRRVWKYRLPDFTPPPDPESDLFNLDQERVSIGTPYQNTSVPNTQNETEVSETEESTHPFETNPDLYSENNHEEGVSSRDFIGTKGSEQGGVPMESLAASRLNRSGSGTGGSVKPQPWTERNGVVEYQKNANPVFPKRNPSIAPKAELIALTPEEEAEGWKEF